MRINVKKYRSCLTAIIAAILLLASGICEAETYKIDPGHSTFGFAVSHVKVSITRGEFTEYSGEIEYDEKDLNSFKGWIAIKSDSINTRLEARDKHLRNEDFFYVENYPTIIFMAKKLIKKGSGYELVGELTMRGVSKVVSGPVTIRGPVKSPFGGKVMGLSGETVVDRRDYGISWNDKMPDGGFVVGNDVRIIIDVEAHAK